MQNNRHNAVIFAMHNASEYTYSRYNGLTIFNQYYFHFICELENKITAIALYKDGRITDSDDTVTSCRALQSEVH